MHQICFDSILGVFKKLLKCGYHLYLARIAEERHATFKICVCKGKYMAWLGADSRTVDSEGDEISLQKIKIHMNRFALTVIFLIYASLLIFRNYFRCSLNGSNGECSVFVFQ